MTVQEIIAGIIAKTGLQPIPQDRTCDHLIAGSYNMEVTKVVTTFMATVEVIKEAARLGANLIITHEPTWYTGMDGTGWLLEDTVYLEKKKLLEENHIAVWRFHDHMHSCAEDGIYRGFEKEFGWAGYRLENVEGSELNFFGACYEIPEISLKELTEDFRKKLSMPVIRTVGNPGMRVKRVGVLVGGYSLGLGLEERPMLLMQERGLDLMICGDIMEWTLSSYIRDAAALGLNKGMLVLGHERSEECGMKYLADWMRSVTGDLEIIFIDAGEPFSYL